MASASDPRRVIQSQSTLVIAGAAPRWLHSSSVSRRPLVQRGRTREHAYPRGLQHRHPSQRASVAACSAPSAGADDLYPGADEGDDYVDVDVDVTHVDNASSAQSEPESDLDDASGSDSSDFGGDEGDDDGDDGDSDEDETSTIAASISQKQLPQHAGRGIRVDVHGKVHFPYPGSTKLTRPAPSTLTTTTKVLRFKLSSTVWKYNAVVNVLRAAGLHPTTKTSAANVYWGRHLPPHAYGRLIAPHQKLNHFPGTWCIGRKDRLALGMARARARFGAQAFGFVPSSFVLPEGRAQLERAMAVASPGSVWIQKPYSSSCGKGIRLIWKDGRMPSKKTRCVVSRYIRNPFLINGFKFDLRLYVVVTCMDPLRIYALDDGLVRFATERFAMRRTTITHRRMHLTNYSVNKGSKQFVKNADAQENDTGSKWSLQALHRWFQDHGIDASAVQDRLDDVLVKTIIAAEGTVSKKCARLRVGRTNCFELFGVDVLLDSNLQPWLLEVNILPSLSSSSPLDKLIKTKLMSDVFHIVGVDAPGVKSSRVPMHHPGVPTPAARSIDLLALSESDIAILREVELENRRRGHLRRLFPNAANTGTYARYFDAQRYNNALVAKWLELPRRVGLKRIGLGD